MVEEVKDDLRRELREKRELRRKVESLLLGTKEGTCPLCGKSKTVIHLRGGSSACRSCLDILENILLAACEPMRREKLLLTLKLEGLLEAET